MTDTIIKQYGKRPNKEYIAEFYNYVFSTLNNLIDTDLEKNLKLVFISYLINENTIVFFKNKHDKLSSIMVTSRYLPKRIQLFRNVICIVQSNCS